MKDKQKKAELLASNDDEAFLGKRLIELDGLCQKRYSTTSTAFLTEAQIEYCQAVLHLFESKVKFFGGYDNAERCVAIFLPNDDFFADSIDLPFSAVRIAYSSSSKITHRDIMGSVLGLGLERNTIGDILVFDDECYIFALKEPAEYIAHTLVKIGRQNANAEIVDIDSVKVPEQKTEEINATVASLRLDAVLAEGFRASREDAKNAVEKQLVQINHKIILQPSHSVKENDVISLRGKGKLILEKISGESRKGRIWIKIQKFI